ncbi:MAG: ROK family protein [Clostridiales bacterium]|nr:ROK family protein [Candidatus Crickella equi]
MKYYIGIDLGGTNVRTILVDEKGKIYSHIKEATHAEEGADAVMERIKNQIRNLDCDVCGGLAGVNGIGIGVPGPIDVKKGCMLMAQNLPGFEGYPICSTLRREFGLPVHINNDANVAGLAEAVLGAGKDYKSVYYITCSTGVGGGYILDRKVVSGGLGYAGEVGNIIIVPGGYKSGIRNPGSAEAEASGNALTRQGKAILGDAIDHAGDVFRLAEEGNEECARLRTNFIEGFSTLLANIAHTVDPECFVIGGGVMESADCFWEELVESFNNKLYPGMRNRIPLLPSEIEFCGAVGAAMLPMTME